MAETKRRNKGKAKAPQRDDDANADTGDANTTTVYLSSLPKSLTSEQLLEHASSIGPVRSAFVVSDKESRESKGFGYVRYVLREDAERAVTDGLGEVQGYKIATKWAKRRLAPEERPEKVVKKIKLEKKTPAVARQKKDFAAVRTVVLQGLPLPADGGNSGPAEGADEEDGEGPKGAEGKNAEAAPLTSKSLYKKARKLGALEKIVYPAPYPSSATSASAYLIYQDANVARNAIPKLHNHVFKGRIITAAPKARLDAVTRLGHAFGGRLIIRNLDFGITEEDLRSRFAPFGPLQGIDVPLLEDNGQIRGRGFAFVWFLSETDAERAMQSLNGQRMWAGAARERIEEETASLKKSEKRKKGKELSEGDGGKRESAKGRVMAVDWALSKKRFEEAEKGPEGSQAAGEGDRSHDPANPSDPGGEVTNDGMSLDDSSEKRSSADEDEAGEGEDEDEDEEEDEDATEGSDHGDDSDSDELSDEDGSQDDARQPEGSTNSIGTTLFVRNLSFEATEDQLYGMFRAFGPLRYARIVLDARTQRSRGTAFVCFWNAADAQSVLKTAKQIEADGAGQGPLAANGQPSLLQADPSSGLAAKLSLHGRVLGISEAVGREEADKLREDRDKSGANKDKRNLYLMREGVIFQNSYEAKGLHAMDLAARQQSFDQRKSLLRSNPSLYISKTRLALRQIPLYVTDAVLKRLGRHALVEWRKEVKAGARKDLSEEELAASTTVKKGEKASNIKQAKILRQADRIDSITGLGKSKGYGFLELTSHADALRVLRWANANPDVSRLFRIWSIEELDKQTSKIEASDSKNEERIKRLKDKRAELKVELEREEAKREDRGARHPEASAKKPRRMLIIEFSIENAQTVQKRKEKSEKAREKARLSKAAPSTDQTLQPPRSEKGTKRKRGQDLESGNKRARGSAPAAAEKQGLTVGRLIGRRRKERKAKTGRK